MNHHFHVIKDPVHGTMQFTSIEDNWIKPFIDSPHFQRLRHIKQLGLADLIFPGAVHTRFNHCLGCCYIACQIAQKIGLADVERQLVMIACLLHDIGHGPFSHAFENIFHQKLIRHEDWTPYFLADYSSSSFFDRYNEQNREYHLTDEKFREIAKMIMHQPVAKGVLADIVSSQLDADRLDYLLRDNHFCGVKYGEYDLRWMLHCMTIINDQDGDHLGITHKGIGALEHYLMARRLMTRNIYHSQKNLALEAFLVTLLIYLSKSLAHHVSFKALSQTRLGQFLMNVDQLNQAILTHPNNQSLKNKFLEDNYANYKDLCDHDVLLLIDQLALLNDPHPARELAKRLKERIMPKIIRLNPINEQLVLAELGEFKQKHHEDFEDWQLQFIQTPHQSYSGEDGPILVINEERLIKPIDDFSFMINAMADKLEHVAFLCIDKPIYDDPRVRSLINHLRISESEKSVSSLTYIEKTFNKNQKLI